MKNLFFSLFLILFSTGIFSSCEKESFPANATIVAPVTVGADDRGIKKVLPPAQSCAGTIPFRSGQVYQYPYNLGNPSFNIQSLIVPGKTLIAFCSWSCDRNTRTYAAVKQAAIAHPDFTVILVFGRERHPIGSTELPIYTWEQCANFPHEFLPQSNTLLQRSSNIDEGFTHYTTTTNMHIVIDPIGDPITNNNGGYPYSLLGVCASGQVRTITTGNCNTPQVVAQINSFFFGT